MTCGIASLCSTHNLHGRLSTARIECHFLRVVRRPLEPYAHLIFVADGFLKRVSSGLCIWLSLDYGSRNLRDMVIKVHWSDPCISLKSLGISRLLDLWSGSLPCNHHKCFGALGFPYTIFRTNNCLAGVSVRFTKEMSTCSTFRL